jgi:hypothetical protein
MKIAAVLAAAVAASPAPAQDAKTFRSDGYPAAVQAALQDARDECRREGGSAVTFAPDTVRTLDLTGDGRIDYIVDLRGAECAGRSSVFCGTAGCDLDIIVALRSGRYRTVFSDRVRDYEILPGRGARTIRFMLHGSYCGGAGMPSCPKTHRISRRPFEFKEPR